MKAANFVGVKSDNRKTDMTYTHNKSRNQIQYSRHQVNTRWGGQNVLQLQIRNQESFL